MKPRIELTKLRDFGEIISDTFTFIFQNIKPLLITFFTFSAVFLLGAIVAASLQQIELQQTLNSINSANSVDDARSVTPFSFFNWGYMTITWLCVVLNYVIISIAITSFMALYREKGNVAPTVEEVWSYIRYYFFRIIGASFVLTLLLGIGLVLCLVPGIWLYPIFALVVPIIVFENASFSYAFNQGFKLIKENWWVTFGTLLVIGIIVWLLRVVVVIPISIVNASGFLFRHQYAHANSSSVWIIVSAVLGQLSTLFLIIPVVASVLCYLNLNEIKEGTGIMGRINALGQASQDNDHLPAEEY